MLKPLILLFVHLISLCCPVLFQARPIDSLNRTSIITIVVTAVVPRVCAPVRSFLLPLASRLRRTRSPPHGKLFYIIIIIVIFAENATASLNFACLECH